MDNILVILVRPKIPGNIGAAARAMANFGFSKLVLVSPECEIDSEARNRAKHAQKILDNARIEKSLSSALKGAGISVATTGIVGSDFNIARAPLLIEDASEKIASAQGIVALVFGAEDTGLTNEELEQCDFTATIPAVGKYPVLNLSHAVAIFLYELSKKKNSRKIKDNFPVISGREKQALEEAMDSAIESVKYRTVFEKRTQKLVWKRILGKSMPTRREAFAMIGLLKKLAKHDFENAKDKTKRKNSKIKEQK